MLKRFFLSEWNMMTAIVLNAGVIFLLSFPSLRDNQALLLADEFFIVLFILEALVKISELGSKAYFADRWNRFDFLVVVLSLPSLLIHFVDIPDTSVFLLLRLLRLFRLVRFLKFIPHLGKIISGLGRAVRASVFVLLTLVMLNFILAILSCHLYGEQVPEFFGDPLISAYSIFQLFTIEGWNEISEAVAEKSTHPFFTYAARFYIGLIVLVGGIFGLSLANAVFVDEMTIDNNDALEKRMEDLKAQIEEIKELLIKDDVRSS
jgi:voltage-gated sodium channel